MGVSRYSMKIVDHETGHVAIGWQPGDKVESELIEAFCKRLSAKNVGWFKSKDAVINAVRTTWAEILYELKQRV